jgi:hypothetical protein
MRRNIARQGSSPPLLPKYTVTLAQHRVYVNADICVIAAHFGSLLCMAMTSGLPRSRLLPHPGGRHETLNETPTGDLLGYPGASAPNRFFTAHARGP